MECIPFNKCLFTDPFNRNNNFTKSLPEKLPLTDEMPNGFHYLPLPVD